MTYSCEKISIVILLSVDDTLPDLVSLPQPSSSADRPSYFLGLMRGLFGRHTGDMN
jgi:hypothetical protein